MSFRLLAIAVSLGVCLASSPANAETQASPVKRAAPCADPEYRQFDFWIGQWTVTGGADGKALLGNNTIERSSNGCWLVEHWRAPKGFEGTSVNAWDKTYKVWRQFWTGIDGTVLRLEGGLRDSAMVLKGELPKRQGAGVQLQRITWTPRGDGSVTQHWETSDDAGASWQTAFHGTYRKSG